MNRYTRGVHMCCYISDELTTLHLLIVQEESTYILKVNIPFLCYLNYTESNY